MTHDHHQQQTQGTNNILIAFLLNFGFSILEFVGGLLTNSTAILSDAVHDMGDSLALVLSLITDKASQKQASANYTYGFKRLSLVGAIINILILSFGTTYIIKEAILAFQSPQGVNSVGMLGLSVLGITINGFAAYRMNRSKRVLDKTVVLHLMEDLLGWIAVLFTSIVIHFTSWFILDPIVSLLIALIVIRNIIKNTIQVYKIIMQAVPDEEMSKAIQMAIMSLEEVIKIDSFYFWSLDGDEHVISLGLIIDPNASQEEVLSSTKEILESYHIEKSCVEIIREGENNANNND